MTADPNRWQIYDYPGLPSIVIAGDEEGGDTIAAVGPSAIDRRNMVALVAAHNATVDRLAQSPDGESPSGPVTDVTPNRPTLTARWLELANSWPTDGWDGAGAARASHAERVRGVEVMLAHLHGTTSHGPFEVDGGLGPGKSARCICGKRMVPTIENAEHIEDPRLIRFDRSTRTYGYVSEMTP